jgi:hypothetical protein
VTFRNFSSEDFSLHPLPAIWRTPGGKTSQSPGEIPVESGAGNILAAEEISANSSTLGATYEVLGGVFKFRNFAVLDTTAVIMWVLLKNGR